MVWKSQRRKNMKLNNLFLTSVSALLLSVAGANAMTIRPFVGATMGLTGAVYTSAAKDASMINTFDLPNDFFTFGIEAGARFGEYTKIYNGGLSLNFDKTTYSNVSNKFTNEKLEKFDLMGFSATYDNYIRISGDKASRIDLVLGAGLAEFGHHTDFVDPAFEDTTMYSMAFALKAGLDFELTKHISLSAMTRMFIPTRSAYDMDINYIVGGAVKYLF